MESELEAAMAADAAAAQTADGDGTSNVLGADASQEEELHRLSFTGEGIDFGGDAPVLELRETPVSLFYAAAAAPVLEFTRLPYAYILLQLLFWIVALQTSRMTRQLTGRVAIRSRYFRLGSAHGLKHLLCLLRE